MREIGQGPERLEARSQVEWGAGRHVLRVLGEPMWLAADGPERVRSKKGLALLCYLASQPRREVSRRQLGAMLWGEFDRAQAAASLATTLSRLKRQIPAWPLAERDDYFWWEPSRGVDTDAAQFSTWLGQQVPWSQVAGLIRGPFLAGLDMDDAPGYMQWLVEERGQWHRQYMDVLWGALAEARDAEDWQGVLRWGRQALELDPLTERFVRAVMTAHAALGDRTAARAVYDQLVRRLSRDLLGAPESATVRLADALTRGTVVALAGGASPPAHGGTGAGGVPLVGRDHLRQQVVAHAAGRGPAPVLLLAGPFGIGKTRLLAEALAGRAAVWAAGDRVWRRDAWFPWNVWAEQAQLDVDGHPSDPRALMAGLWRTRGAEASPVLVLDDAHALGPRAWLRIAEVLRAPSLGGALVPVIVALDRQAAVGAVLQICQAWVDQKWAWWLEVPPLTPAAVEQLWRTVGEDRRLGGGTWDDLLQDTRGWPLALVSRLGTPREQSEVSRQVAAWLAAWPPSVRAVWEAVAMAPAGVRAESLLSHDRQSDGVMLRAIDRVVATGWIQEVARADEVWLKWAVPALGDLVRRQLSATRQAYWRKRLADGGDT